jgi:hypothetical protein
VVITIYRSDCYLFHADGWQILTWSEWSFHPISGGELTCYSGNRKLRDQPIGFQVVCPLLARMTEQGLLLSGQEFGIDAYAVWHFASEGRKGFRIQEVDVKQQSLFGEEKPVQLVQTDSKLLLEAKVVLNAGLPDAETADALRELINRAIEALNKDLPMTARAILQGVDDR